MFDDPTNYVKTGTPKQWDKLVYRRPELKLSKEAPRPIELTYDEYRALAQVHEEILKLPYKRDVDLHDATDYWTPANGRGGDCEDLALARQVRLMEQGWSKNSLSLCLCISSAGYHAVLLVFTMHGFVVLDNWMWLPAGMPELSRDLSTLSGYTWVSRSDPRGYWVSMRHGEGLEETKKLHPNVRRYPNDYIKEQYLQKSPTA